ncbi:methionine aminopeptidase 1D [Tropilaelaps mercedesae]|uniref:Methionine aminopeptidase 1D n=1 Tax=Tropilaelaps mercedesae TaxID=418985 RepID=A0A1V9X946_9ACAR|nr:methionine aminopeptidase 1D [Tropilaelaps mercedesae]
MFGTITSRLGQLVRVPRRGITSLTKDNSRRNHRRFLNYEVVIPAKHAITCLPVNSNEHPSRVNSATTATGYNGCNNGNSTISVSRFGP